MMKFNLDQVTPENPTEAILLQYARFLEHRLMEERSKKSSRIGVADLRDEIKVSQSTMKNYRLHGVVMSELTAHENGYELWAKTDPLEGNGKSFMVTTFVQDPRRLSRSARANMMYAQLKECMNNIGGIFE
jgi:hypothetical protein